MKQLLLLIILLSAFSSLYGFQSHDGPLIEKGEIIDCTYEPSFGYLTGQAREIVYADSEGTYLSELIWDLDNIFFAGISASINVMNRFYINAGIWAAVNSGSGEMMDFDWLNLLGNNFDTYDDYGRSGWTNWSLSSVDIVDSYIFDINISYDFLTERAAKFSLIMGYNQFYWDWTDKIVDSLYPSGPDVIEPGTNAIDYQLQLRIPYVGIGLAWFTESFLFGGKLSYSPLVMTDDHDHHILTGTHYYDTFSYGTYFSLSVKSGFRLQKHIFLSAQVDLEYLFESRGDIYMYNNSDIFLGKTTGGAGIQYQAAALSLNGAISF